jgi:hypothetical protein
VDLDVAQRAAGFSEDRKDSAADRAELQLSVT